MILKTMDGVMFKVSDEEAEKIMKAVMKGDSSHILVRSVGAFIPRSSIALYPEALWEEKEGIGVLHDGTRVIRKFGQWVDERNPEARLSWEHYPEIIQDNVMTPSEFEKNRARLLAAPDARDEYLKIAGEKKSQLTTL